MATSPPSPQSPSAEAAGPRSTASWALPLALACIGLVLGWAWLRYAPPLVDTIAVGSVGALACLYYGLVYLPIAALALVLGTFCRVKPWRAGNRLLPWSIAGMGAGVLALGMSFGLARINGGVARVPDPGQAGGALLALGIGLTLLQCGIEEMFFRGWLRLTLRSLLGMPLTTVLTALAYAAFNLAGNSFAVLSLVNLVLFGLFYNLLAERSGGIAAPIAAHFGWAALEDMALGLNPNPGRGPFGSLGDYDLLGSPLWGGTEAGLAASIGTSAVLLALILPLAAWRKQETLAS